jgi:hypothetical protein
VSGSPNSSSGGTSKSRSAAAQRVTR